MLHSEVDTPGFMDISNETKNRGKKRENVFSIYNLKEEFNTKGIGLVTKSVGTQQLLAFFPRVR